MIYRRVGRDDLSLQAGKNKGERCLGPRHIKITRRAEVCSTLGKVINRCSV